MLFVKKHFSILFLALGFLFDLLTLKRIDQSFTLVQHGVFIVALAVLLSLVFLQEQNFFSEESFILKNRKIINAAMHFLFGGLLSAFTIFYFKSSSLMTSFLFLSLLIGLLLLNEHPSFQSQGLKFKFALFSLCLISYFSYLIPTLIGFIGLVPLLMSVALVILTMILLTLALDKPEIPKESLKREITIPCLSVMAIFLMLYALKLIPPVPLSVKHIGIYRDVQRNASNQFELSYARSWWKFWQDGEQDFMATDGDKIYCFASIFSPTKFSDKIFFHWSIKAKGNWVLQDKVPIAISGGRDQGFRAYTYKSKYQEGSWRVQVKTEHGFELSRIYFDVFMSDQSKLDIKKDLI